jgi:RNA polymerase sigma-70 factor (ECF subfamily)
VQDATSPFDAPRTRLQHPAGLAFAEVLERAQSGDEEAWGELYDRHAGSVRGYVAMRGASDPDDCVGEVFVHLARGLHRFVGSEAEFRSWVFMVAHNRVVDERRRAARRPVVPVAELDETAAPAQPDAESEALAALGLDRVAGLLRDLTPEQRAVLLLRFVGDLTLEEVATVVGRPLGAVKQLQRRALRSLKRRLIAADVPN